MDKIFGNIHKDLAFTDKENPKKKYQGKCGRCLLIKEDFEEPPTEYDLIVCDKCYSQICKEAARDQIIKNIINELEELRSFNAL